MREKLGSPALLTHFLPKSCLKQVVQDTWSFFIQSGQAFGPACGKASFLLLQIKYFLGYTISSSNKIVPVLKSIFKNIDKFKWQPFIMGMIFLGFLLGMRAIGKKLL